MSGSSGDFGVPVSVCPPRGEVEKLAYSMQRGEEVAKRMWVGCLASEYRALQLAELGVRLVEVKTSSTTMPLVSSDVSYVYRELASAKRESGASEVSKYAARAYAEKNPDHLVTAARKFCELARGSDRYVTITTYSVGVAPLKLSKEDAERVKQLASRVLEVLAPLGGAAEAALLKLIASGYRRGAAESIAELDPSARRFLEELLDKPFDRAALLYAYRRLAGFRKLMSRVLRDTLNPDTGRHSILQDWIPEPEHIAL